uniref:Protein FAM161A n=1 Tax=Seriola lalandi dorsalis TaxID=1841481 RepID=A0A3B4Y312_SERLL
MANAHRTNVLVTSCLKTPVDPQTKAPLASYERERVLPYTATPHMDNREYEKEVNTITKITLFRINNIFFSNEEYYSKLEELKKAHLRTMAELESMYRRKLELKCMEPLDMATLETGHRLLWSNTSPAAARRLRKSHSAVELRRSSGQSDLSYEDEAANNDVEKGLQGLKVGEQSWKHRVTVPKPFHMTVREAERRKRGVKTRSEMEVENAELRRQLEGLTECQRKFRASPVPAHVHLPLYEELQEQYHERRQNMRDREEQHLRTVQKPFSFLERERLKKEQKQLRHPQPSDQEKVKPFKAKPVPKAVYAAASGEQMKEERLYRSIKTQMRAQELLHSASMPPSMLARRLSDRKKTKDDAAGGGDNSFTHRPQINKEIPDFNASYQRFQKQLEKRKEVKPTTACEPFDLRTSQISSHRDRILADIEKEQSPRMLRWPYINSGAARTPNSSLCSSLSGSLEVLPAKVTDATKRRHEAVRKQEQQRRKEYQQEMKEMQQRVKGRPLLLEQVAQVKKLNSPDLDMGYLPVHYRKVFLDDDDDEDVDDPDERERGREDEESDEASFNQRYGEDPGGQRSDEDDRGDDRDHHYSDESYHYSDDHEEYSEDSEHDADTKQEAGE